jgi:hypothetical protein
VIALHCCPKKLQTTEMSGGISTLPVTVTALCRTGIHILSLGWPGTAWVVLV